MRRDSPCLPPCRFRASWLPLLLGMFCTVCLFDGRCWYDGSNCLCCLQTVHARHGPIQNDHVGAQLDRPCDRFFPIDGVSANFPTRLGQQRPKSSQHGFVVIGDRIRFDTGRPAKKGTPPPASSSYVERTRKRTSDTEGYFNHCDPGNPVKHGARFASRPVFTRHTRPA